MMTNSKMKILITMMKYINNPKVINALFNNLIQKTNNRMCQYKSCL